MNLASLPDMPIADWLRFLGTNQIELKTFAAISTSLMFLFYFFVTLDLVIRATRTLPIRSRLTQVAELSVASIFVAETLFNLYRVYLRFELHSGSTTPMLLFCDILRLCALIALWVTVRMVRRERVQLLPDDASGEN